MATATFPAIEKLLPQQGPMCLLDRVLSHDPSRTRCAVRIDADSLFALPDASGSDASGTVPGYLALEWMAQCASAHAALLALARSEAPPIRGLLLGTRALELTRASYACGEELEVEARHLQGTEGLVVFACTVRVAGQSAESAAEAPPLASGRINLYAAQVGSSRGPS